MRIKTPVSQRTLSRLLQKAGLHAVGGCPGLCLAVASKGDGASWVLRYTSVTGERKPMGLGSLIDVSLAEAREIGLAQRKLLAHGVDPMSARRETRETQRLAATRSRTFAQVTEEFLTAKEGEIGNAKHRREWRETLMRYVVSTLGALNVRNIDSGHIVQVLSPHWLDKNVTMKRLRGRIEKVLGYAIACGYCSDPNVARWKDNLDHMLASPAKVHKEQHLAALPYHEIAGFMRELRKQDSTAAAALEFLILNASRSGEVLGATWDEIDMGARTWTIPPDRMKARREHKVPLPDSAMAVLRRVQSRRAGKFVFPGARKGKPLAARSFTVLLERMGYSHVTTHGFRSAFKDWARESTDFATEISELQLAHRVGSAVERAYARSALVLKRRALVKAWADWCNTARTPAKVLQAKRKE